MHQRNDHEPKPSPANPPKSTPGQAYLALLVAGWVFVVGMAVLGPWAVGTQVESRLVIAPALVEEQATLAQDLKQHLEVALAHVFWAAPTADAGGLEGPRDWRIHWERLSLAQQRELMQRLGLSLPPSHFQIRWNEGKKRSELVVRMVHPSPGAAPAQLQHLLHQAGDQAVASYKQKLSQKLATVRAQARQHWQALIQTDSRLRQWLLEVLGPQATVTPVAYWQRIPAEAEQTTGSPVLRAAVEPEGATGEDLPEFPEDAQWASLTIQQLRRRVAELEAQDQELAARLTELHPQRQQIRETLRRLRVYLARRLKQAGEQLPTTPARAVLSQAQAETQAQQQVAQLLQQHAQRLRRFQQELDRLSQAYMETAEQEAQLWQQYRQFEQTPPLNIAPPRFGPVWLTQRRNLLALLLVAGGLLAAAGVTRWQRWSQDTFTSTEQMSHELNQPVVAVPSWWYEASAPPRKLWRQRLQRLQRLLEWSLLGMASGWALLAVLQVGFRNQWVQDPLLAIACTWRFLVGG